MCRLWWTSLWCLLCLPLSLVRPLRSVPGRGKKEKMGALELLSTIFLVIGAAFFVAGTVGLLRFPDIYTRLHALAKADNLGLGFVVLGLLIQAPGPAAALKLILVWLLALAASATVSFLIARRALDKGIVPWRTTGRET
jgi:multicomponent Na+:H+ antiporter subunit G